MGQHGRATTRPNLGRAREIARSVLAETLSGSDEYITLWPTDEDDTPHVPTTVKTIRGNYKVNSVGAAALSSVDGDEAVNSAHVRTGAATKRWFGAGDSPDLSEGVQVPVQRLRANGGNIDHDLLPNVQKEKLPNDTVYKVNGKVPKADLPGDAVYGNSAGKVERAKIVDKLNGKDLIQPGTLSVDALASKPWRKKTDEHQVRKIVRDMVKSMSLKPKAR